MTHLPRRTLRVKPPLRGRAATKQCRGKFAPITSVHRPLSPYGSGGLREGSPISPSPETGQPAPAPPIFPNPPLHDKGLYADLVDFYKRWGRFLRSLDSPWQWLIVLAIVLTSLFLLNQLL